MSKMAMLPRPERRMCKETRKHLEKIDKHMKIKAEKQKQIEKFGKHIKKNVTLDFINDHSKIIFFNHTKMKTSDNLELRYQLWQEKLKVKKIDSAPFRNTLRQQPTTAHMASSVKHQMSVAYSNELEINTKSVMRHFKMFRNCEIVGAVIDYQGMTPDEMTAYGKLPSLQKHREELVQLLSQPGIELSQLLTTNQNNLVHTLSSYVQQMTEDGEEGGEVE